MGNGQPKRNTLTEGARIDFRKKVKQLLTGYHETSIRKFISHVYFQVLVIGIRVASSSQGQWYS